MRNGETSLKPGTAGSTTRTGVTRGLDQVVAIETPEQVVFSYTVAGIGSRAAAALIDHAIIIASIIGLFSLYQFVIVPALGNTSDASILARHTGAWVLAALLLVQFVAQWGYYVLFEAVWDGQTPGKRWLGLRVVQDGGYSVTFAASAARNIARILDMQPALTYLVGLVTVAVSKTGKRAGDQLAGTIVVRERIVRLDEALLPGGRPATGEPLADEASLTEDEFDLLQRFLARADTLDVARRDSLALQLTARFRESLPDVGDPVARLRSLAAREREARTLGAGGRGEMGTARERHAIIAEGRERWIHFAGRLAEVQRRGLRRLSGREVARFVAEYREVAADLARLSTATRGHETDTVFQLSRLVAGGHNLLYRQERVAAHAIARFLLVSVPAELRRSAVPVLAAAALFFGSGGAALVGVLRDPGLVEELVGPGMIDRAEIDAARARAGDARYIDIEDYTRPILASTVLRNNVQVTFFAFASGLTAGVLTVVLLLMNGISIGAAIGLFVTKGVGRLILDFVVAHSVFELSAICIAGGAGFIIAGAILLPGSRPRREALVIEGRRALRLLAASALMLVFAGAIEGLISPRVDVGFAFKGAVAVVSALLLVVYTLLGRNERPGTVGEPMAYSEERALIAR